MFAVVGHRVGVGLGCETSVPTLGQRTYRAEGELRGEGGQRDPVTITLQLSLCVTLRQELQRGEISRDIRAETTL